MYLTILFLDRITLIQQFSVRSLFIKRNTGTSARSISYRAPPSAHNSDRKDSPPDTTRPSAPSVSCCEIGGFGNSDQNKRLDISLY